MKHALESNTIKKLRISNFYLNMKMNFDDFIWKLTLFQIFGEVN